MPDDRFNEWRTALVQRGEIAPLFLGALQEEVTKLLGHPDRISTEHRMGHPIIYKYGDIEFHFDHLQDHRLVLVYAEDQDGKPLISLRK